MPGKYRLSSSIVLAASLLAPRAAAQPAPDLQPAVVIDPYDAAFERARVLEQRGDYDAAARSLEPVATSYPQDYAVALEIGWLRARAGRWAAAESAYRAAVARSPAALDARLGLAWAIAKQGRCAEAAPLFRSVLEERPDDAGAREGLAACAPKPSWQVTPRAQLTGMMWPAHPIKSYGLGASAGLGIGHVSGFSIGALYRYTRFAVQPTSSVSPWEQHELYLDAGWGNRIGGVSLRYALAVDGSGYTGTSHHAGVSLRWSPWGDIVADGSASFYSDLYVYRVEPSWRIPIAGGFSVRPAAGVQFIRSATSDEKTVTGLLTLAYDHRVVSLWLGGKYGDEVRPAYLGSSAIYNIAERIDRGLWAGVSVAPGGGLRLGLSYALDHLVHQDASTSDAHTISLGASKAF